MPLKLQIGLEAWPAPMAETAAHLTRRRADHGGQRRNTSDASAFSWTY